MLSGRHDAIREREREKQRWIRQATDLGRRWLGGAFLGLVRLVEFARIAFEFLGQFLHSFVNTSIHCLLKNRVLEFREY